MKFRILLKFLILVVFLGSATFYSDPALKTASNSFQHSNPNDFSPFMSEQIDKMEIVFWIALLAVLGASTSLLILIFALMMKKPDLYFKDIYSFNNKISVN